VQGALAVGAGGLWGGSLAQRIVAAFEPWRRGWLDIHHISTGRGNSVLAICPDGTSLMIDAGAAKSSEAAMGPARPDTSHRPGEWIGRYALRHLKSAPRQEIDCFVLTHLHGDHMGDVMPDSPLDGSGKYRLTGISDVDAVIPIRRLIDRGYPDYGYPGRQTYDGALNYIEFAHALARRGRVVERVRVGSRSQIAVATTGFEVRNLAANGEIWTGQQERTVRQFPDLKTLKPDEFPSENVCSIALRVQYGVFRYYIGGDLGCDTRFGTAPWLDVESAVARVAGPVQVAALDHHGYFDGTGEEFVRRMRARIYVAQTWHASHPALAVLDRLYSPLLYPGPRDVLATDLHTAAALADDRYASRLLSQHGHVVVRVGEDGKQYEVLVLDDTVEAGAVVARFGPYLS